MKILVVFVLLYSVALAQAQPPMADIPLLVQEEIDRCGLIVDAHLHEAPWFVSNPSLLFSEMDASGISEGVILAVYGPSNPFGTDPNQVIESLLNDRLFGLASLNTTVDWESQRDTELNRLATYLERPGFVGTKIAPPHTCLPLNSTILDEVLGVISASSHPVIGIHLGTTPFCGPFGMTILGKIGCCEEEYVDPFVMEPFVEKYSDVSFVLMHSGQDFGFDPVIPFYNGTNFDHSLELALTYSNVWLEISANLARDAATQEYRNPLAFENLVKIADAGLKERTIYGSDSNQYPGGMLAYLNSTVISLIEANFTEEERCQILIDNARAAYHLDEAWPAEETATSNPTKTPTITSNPMSQQTSTPTESPTMDATLIQESAATGIEVGRGMRFLLVGALVILILLQ